MTIRFSSTTRARGTLFVNRLLVAVGVLVASGIVFAASPEAVATGPGGDDPDVSVTVPDPTSPSNPAPSNPAPSTPPLSSPAPSNPAGPGPGSAPGSAPVAPPASNIPPGQDPAAPPAQGGGDTPTVCVPTEPAVPAAPAAAPVAAAEQSATAEVDKDVYLPGENVTMNAAGYDAEEKVQYVLFSEPKVVGTATADASGAVTATFAVPKESPNGTQVAQLTGWCGAIAKANVLIGRATAERPMGLQGVPVWVWWVGGGGAAAAVAVGGWRIASVMRRPEGIG